MKIIWQTIATLTNELGVFLNRMISCNQKANILNAHFTINKNVFVVCGIFIISPLLALPVIVVEVLNKRKYANYFLCVFLGICSILWAPTGDLYRHNLLYYNYVYTSKFEFLPTQIDWVVYYINWIFAKAGINFEYIRCIFIIISYLIAFWFIKCISQESRFYKTNYRYLVGIILLSVKFVSITFGLRYGFACQLLALSYYMIFYRHNKWGWIFAVIAAFTHYSISVLVIVFLVGKIYPSKSKLFAFIGLPLLICSNTNVLEIIIKALPLPDLMKAIAISYASGYWSGEFIQNKSLFYRIAQILWNIETYYLAWVFLTRKSNDKLNQVVALLIFVLCLLSSSLEFYYRILSALTFPLLFWALRYISIISSKPLLKRVFLLTLISFLSELYSMRFVINISEFDMLLTSNFYELLNHTYGMEWINSHINSDGSIANPNY